MTASPPLKPFPSNLTAYLTFEQKEKLLLQLEQDRVKLEIEREKPRFNQANIEIQKYHMEVIESGLGDIFRAGSQGASQMFDSVGNLRLVPKFNEHEPDMFFMLFEQLVEAKGWPSKECTLLLLLQCVLTCRAHPFSFRW